MGEAVVACDDALCAEFGHAPCRERNKSAFWESVARAAAEVATWPDYKKAGVIAKPNKEEK